MTLEIVNVISGELFFSVAHCFEGGRPDSVRKRVR